LHATAALRVVDAAANRASEGLRVYLMGTNPLAARFAGIDNAWITLRTYTICGTLSACAGLSPTRS